MDVEQTVDKTLLRKPWHIFTQMISQNSPGSSRPPHPRGTKETPLHGFHATKAPPGSFLADEGGTSISANAAPDTGCGVPRAIEWINPESRTAALREASSAGLRASRPSSR